MPNPAVESRKPLARKTVYLSTKVDRLFDLLKVHKRLAFGKIAAELAWTPSAVETVGKILEEAGLVDVEYPATMVQSPRIPLRKELPPEPLAPSAGKILAQYPLLIDFVPAEVNLVQGGDDSRPLYELNTPVLGVYTRVFLERLRDRIAEKIPIEVTEITDESKSVELKKKFFDVAKTELKSFLGENNEETLNALSGFLLHSMYGLGNIELFMADHDLEEIAINSSKTPVTVYHRKHGWLKTNLSMSGEEAIANTSALIGRKVGRDITTLNPILDAHLVTGDRVNATLFPVSSLGNTLTIRRFARRPWTVIDFIGSSHTMNVEMAALLWEAMQYELNILVAGGTASGKTAALNTLSAFIPSYHRVISIEDVREIMLPRHMAWNWVPLTTRNPNPEGLGEVSMLDLMYSSLRMRPDRIIVGEIRRQKEAEVLFEAMHTGHSVYSTIHANSSAQVMRRLTEPPISVPPLEVEAIDLVLVQYRDRRTNLRRTYELAEIESGVTGNQLSINPVYRWKPREDAWESVNKPTKFLREINLHTGLTEKEVNQELDGKALILNWMLANHCKDIDEVGAIMKSYYSDAERLLEAAKKNAGPATMKGI